MSKLKELGLYVQKSVGASIKVETKQVVQAVIVLPDHDKSTFKGKGANATEAKENAASKALKYLNDGY